MPKAIKACSGLTHPRATEGPQVKRGTLTYIDLLCPTCGRSQGLRLVRKTRTTR